MVEALLDVDKEEGGLGEGGGHGSRSETWDDDGERKFFLIDIELDVLEMTRSGVFIYQRRGPSPYLGDGRHFNGLSN